MVPLVVIAGPTGSGKSRLAVTLARTFRGEIISADSRQVYQGTPIATDVLPLAERGGVPHHLLEVVPFDYHFTAAEFQERAAALIDDITARGALPFLVGGTGLYIRAVVDGFSFAGGVTDPRLREKLQRLPLEKLQALLQRRDPEAAATIDLQNRRRVARALEIVLTSKRPLRQHQSATPPPYHTLQLAPTVSRGDLYHAIEERLNQQLSAGLEAEIKTLYDQFGAELLAERGLSYRHFASFFVGKMSREEAIALTLRDTRRLAKRQLTWFRADHRIHWISTPQEAAQLVRTFLGTVRPPTSAASNE